MKDGDGNYLWQPAAKAGEASTLMGYPGRRVRGHAQHRHRQLLVAFGDFRRGYLIVDRVGIRVLRDPYSSKPYVLFYTTKRVGGGVQDFDAIKLLKFAVSRPFGPDTCGNRHSRSRRSFGCVFRLPTADCRLPLSFAEARVPPPRPRATRAGPHVRRAPPPRGGVPLAPSSVSDSAGLTPRQ